MAQLEHLFEKPVTSGSVYRVPNTAYPAWGLRYRSETLADEAYQAEWNVANGDKLPALVGEASKRAFGADYAQLVRDAAANTVGAIVDYLLKNKRLPGRLRLLEIGAGAGASTLAIHRALPDQVKDDITFVLVDPSGPSLEVADQLMHQNNIKHEIKVGSDTQVLPTLEPGSVDILTGVASIHHHARIPFEWYSRVLKEGSFAVFADWHQKSWTHPSFVLDMVSLFNYPGKKRDLAEFLKNFPQAKEKPDIIWGDDRIAMMEIFRFWEAVADISQEMGLEGTPIWFLEGHRGVEEYVREMNQAWLTTRSLDIRKMRDIYSMRSNPHQISPESNLLWVTVGQKIAA